MTTNPDPVVAALLAAADQAIAEAQPSGPFWFGGDTIQGLATAAQAVRDRPVADERGALEELRERILHARRTLYAADKDRTERDNGRLSGWHWVDLKIGEILKRAPKPEPEPGAIWGDGQLPGQPGGPDDGLGPNPKPEPEPGAIWGDGQLPGQPGGPDDGLGPNPKPEPAQGDAVAELRAVKQAMQSECDRTVELMLDGAPGNQQHADSWRMGMQAAMQGIDRRIAELEELARR